MNKPLSLKIQGFFTIMMKLSEKEYKKAINLGAKIQKYVIMETLQEKTG